MHQVLLARQPIYDDRMGLHAYELLYRGAAAADEMDGDQATADVLVGSLLDIGLDRIVGDRPAFINFTRGMLQRSEELPFPRDRIVIELLEDITPDQELVERLRHLRAEGYTIALDDFHFGLETRHLLDMADIVKLDVLSMDQDHLRDHVAELKRGSAQLLAEKVETADDVERCRKLGFDLYQGYFFARPNLVSASSASPNQMTVLQLLAALNAADVEIEDLEDIVQQDVGLTVKVMSYVNSAFFNTANKIGSIRDAIVYLGIGQVRTLASLLLMATLDDKPPELMNTALVRGKFCELLAGGRDPGSVAFVVGLLSVLDALLDTPMPAIVEKLHLSDEISAALLSHEGPAGETLSCVLAHERGAWETATDRWDQDTVAGCYLSALQWSDDSLAQLRRL